MKKENMQYEAPQVMVFEYVAEGVFCTSTGAEPSMENVIHGDGEW